MTQFDHRVAVTSKSFSKNEELKGQLLDHFPNSYFNEAGSSLSGESLIDFLAKADYALTALEKIDRMVLSRTPHLRAISKIGVGTDMINFNALEQYGVRFLHYPGTNKRSVSELVISLALSLLRRIPLLNHEAKAGQWRQLPGTCLSQKTFGILGMGHVGKDLAKLLVAFGCEVLYYDPFLEDSLHGKAMPLRKLLEQADLVSIHLPLNKNTDRMIGADELSFMRKGSYLINTSRGGILDEKALHQSLSSDHLGGAALDVFEEEPPIGNPLLLLENVIVTPHVGGSTREAIHGMGMAAIDGLRNYCSSISKDTYSG